MKGVRLGENMGSEDVRNCLGPESEDAPNILQNTHLKKKKHICVESCREEKHVTLNRTFEMLNNNNN